jgi:hypothetical protein
MRVVLERLGVELVLAPMALSSRSTGARLARVDTADGFALEQFLRRGLEPGDVEGLRSLLASLDPIGVADRPDDSVVSALIDHIRWGRIGVFELELVSASVRQEELEEARPFERKTRHFIEIQLVDEIGAPVANERYQITLPDGKIREGRTDGKGVIRFDGIDAGVCDFTFMGLDEAAWEPA